MEYTVRTKTGKELSDITLDAVLKRRVGAEDIKISGETLNNQANIARSNGYGRLADNFDRAAELVNVPDDVILSVYNMLRPHRATKAELLSLADTLEHTYNAPECAFLVHDAAAVYERRGILK